MCLLLCAAAYACDPPDIPADLVQVKTEGQWQDGDTKGFLRFSAFERGFDNVRHQVVIEWIQVPASANDKPRVVSRLTINDIPDAWSVGDATIALKEGRTFIHFEATNSYLPEKHAKFSIDIQGVGKAKVTAIEQGGDVDAE